MTNGGHPTLGRGEKGAGQTSARIVAYRIKTGTDPDVWDIDGAGDEGIQGFSTDISVNVGSTVQFKIKTDASNYTIQIFRLGYYGGDGARLVAEVAPTAALPQIQPACATDATRSPCSVKIRPKDRPRPPNARGDHWS